MSAHRTASFLRVQLASRGSSGAQANTARLNGQGTAALVGARSHYTANYIAMAEPLSVQ